ncbi:unnamed protein product [Notodromas monacha]|uniref:mitogen-activated protein kinase kinase n=1 Tax=Notodromas monacha TaxID=399045 RepID=A0A7R9GC33_9CRUS|nr:unnamed protein product [Notodromas monacha]CAG0917059.1 unnamed protein product [Notodromas monacha]
MDSSPSMDSLSLSDDFSTVERKNRLRLSFNNPEKQRQPVEVRLPISGGPAYFEPWKIPGGFYSTGKLTFSESSLYEFTAEDLVDLGEIGRGAFGTVNKMVHRQSNYAMAVKRIRSTVDEREQKNLMRELEVIVKSSDCPSIVKFYGAIFKEVRGLYNIHFSSFNDEFLLKGDCWICMELMHTSLDKFYRFVYEELKERIPEILLQQIAKSVSWMFWNYYETIIALQYLRDRISMIHRDVKPSNILLDRRGDIKLCDFGICGKLVNSIAKTRDAGCEPYMAPERIDPRQLREYDVRSDVWSLGITVMELATGKFPYPKWNTVFEQVAQVVDGCSPRLKPEYPAGEMGPDPVTFSTELVDFVNFCLTKNVSCRPRYPELLCHAFVARSIDAEELTRVVCGVLDRMPETLTTNCYKI